MRFTNSISSVHEYNKWKDFAFIAVIYLISWGIMLLNDGIYWDDWQRINASASALMNQNIKFGYILSAYLDNFILTRIHNITFYRLYLVLAYLGIVYIFFDILGNIRSIERIDRFFITCIFAVLPINYARISVSMTLMFNTYLLLFFMAFWLLSKYMTSRHLLYRIFSIILFFVSFSTPSYLVYYSLALIYIYYIDKQRTPFKNVAKRMLNYADYFVIPILFWILRTRYFMPYGHEADYNRFTIEDIITSPIRLINDVRYLLNKLVSMFSETLSTDFIELLIMSTLIAYIANRILHDEKPIECVSSDAKNMMMGVVFLVIAVFPYALVSKHPWFDDLNTRHQILCGLGLSFIIYYFVKIAVDYLKVNTRVFIVVLALIIGSAIWINITTLIEYQKDAFKQKSLLSHIEKSHIMRDNTSFLIIDNIPYLNAFNRTYRFYEYNGMMKRVFNDTRRFADSHPNVWQTESENVPVEELNMNQFVPIPPQYEVYINQGTLDLRSANKTMKMLYLYWFKRGKFNEEIKNLITLNYKKRGETQQ